MVTTVRAVVSVVGLLSILVCCSRLYLRKFVLRSFGLDDYLVIVALILVIGFAVLSIIITFYGIGQHQDTVAPEDFPTMQKIVYASLCTYLFVATAVKLSLTVFIMRIFPQRYVQHIGMGIIAFLAVFTISGEFALIFQCTPIQAAYDKSMEHYKCFSQDTLFGINMYQGVLMFLVDVVIIILPMPSIWQLQMPTRKRILIVSMFCPGGLACIAALIRLPTLVYQKDPSDYTYKAAKSLIWMNVEFNIGLIIGSIPTLYRLIQQASRFLISGSWSRSRTKGDEKSTERRAQEYPLDKRAHWTQQSWQVMRHDHITVQIEDNGSQETILSGGKRGVD
ncbi:hypothetical protein MAP00_004302 [Monascus purpureus]|nr:hypothetical protein MAP00_004302 [Monascus purpureus]